MDSFLKPARFNTDPESPQAAEEWLHWHTTFDNFIDSAKVEDDAEKYKLLINFISPTVFTYINEHKTYKPAVKALRFLYVKPRNTMYARHLLYSTKQQPHQSLDDYLRTLRTLAKDCNYTSVTAEEHRNESIRDAFISGLSSNFILQRLLESETLSLEQASTLARTLDLAQKNAENYNNKSFSNPMVSAVKGDCEPPDPGGACALSSESVSVSAVKPSKSKFIPKKSYGGGSCWFCGESPRHPRSACPAREDTCPRCGKVGHWAKMCHSKPIQSVASSLSPFIPRLGAVSTPKTPYSKVVIENIHVNGFKAGALLDSGAIGNFIDQNFVDQHKLTVFPANFSVGLASGSQSSKVLGVCFVTLKVKGQFYNNIRMGILSDLVADVILGDSFMNEHSSVIFQFGGAKPSLVLSSLPTMNVMLPPMFSNLDRDIKPIAVKSRRFSLQDRLFIKTEIQRLLSNGVIKPSRSPWRAQVLVDRKEGRKPRLCIDYSRTVNLYTTSDAYPIPRIDEMVNAVAQNKVLSVFDLTSAYHQCELAESDQVYTGFEADGKLFEFTRLPFGLTNAVAAFQRLMDDLVEENQLEGVFVYIDNITVAGKTQEQHDHNVRKFLEVAKEKNLTFNEGKTILNTDTITMLGYQVSNGLLSPDPDRVKPLMDMPVPHNLAGLRRVLGMFAYYARWIPNYSDTVRPLLQSKSIPLSSEAIQSFNKLK